MPGFMNAFSNQTCSAYARNISQDTHASTGGNKFYALPNSMYGTMLNSADKLYSLFMDVYHKQIVVIATLFYLIFLSVYLLSGVAPGIFRRGADSFDEGAKIWFSGYYQCQKSPKKLLFTFRRELACSDGGL